MTAPEFLTRLRRGLGRHRLLLALLAADVFSKSAAFLLLPLGEPVTVLPGLRLYLAINAWGVMGGEHGMAAVAANPVYTMLLAFGLLLFAIVIVLLGSSGLSFALRFFVGAAFFLTMAFTAQAVGRSFAAVELPPSLVVTSIRAAVLLVTLAFYAASRSAPAVAAFTLLAAGALGNALSYVYPPFEVVDFFMVPLQVAAALVGHKLEPTAFGVINFADLYLFAFPLLLAYWPLHALLRASRRRAGSAREAG